MKECGFTSADYAGASGSAFAWNEWEQVESDGADAGTAAEIRAFWDAHLPILHTVGGDYSYLAVCVDRASADYGCVVQGYAPESRETSTLCRSFDELLEQIKGMEHGELEGDLAPFIMHPHDQRWLRSEQARARARRRQGLFGGLLERLRTWRVFESYRIAVVVERRFSRPLSSWEIWSRIMASLDRR